MVIARTFIGVRLCIPTAFGIIATGWPFARISIADDAVELFSILPLRSEWYSSFDDVSSIEVDGQNVLIVRGDGGTARFRFWSWQHDAIAGTLVERGLPVRRVDKIAYTGMRQDW